MKLKFAGGASTVTGSCYHIEINQLKILVDCGMHQGEGIADNSKKPFSFKPSDINYVFITHAHMDHSGLLPRLMRDGFRGTIYCTPPTRDLLEPMLYDSAAVQNNDALWISKRNLRTGGVPVEPLYTAEDVSHVLPMFEPRPYDKIFHLAPGVKFRFLDAGHILGSASLELWYQDSADEKKIVFSGDIGKKESPILKDPLAPKGGNYIVMESTYGDRLHRPMEESVGELATAIRSAFRRGGNIYIPTFAVGRTQDVIYILNNLVRENRIYKIDVYLDSPLAEEVTRVYLEHPECFDEEARTLFSKQHIGSSIRLHFVRSVEESMKLNSLKSCNIIMAGSGMCEGGRIRHHLKHNLWRSECSVIFVGYQANGTLGRKIINGARSVNILGEEIAVRAAIYTINGFSAHADREGLLQWLSASEDRPEVFITHGEDKSADAFALAIKERFGFVTHRPRDGDEVEL